MTEKKKDATSAKQDEGLDRVLRATTPSDFDGHTDFGRLTVSQRLDWLAQAAAFVHEFKGRVPRRGIPRSRP